MNKEQVGVIRGWMYVLGVWLCGSEVVAYYRRTSKKSAEVVRVESTA